MNQVGDVCILSLKGFEVFLGNFFIDSFSCVHIFISLKYVLRLYSILDGWYKAINKFWWTSTYISRASMQHRTRESRMIVDDFQCQLEDLEQNLDSIKFVTTSIFWESVLGILSLFLATYIQEITFGWSSSSQAKVGFISV